MESNVKLLKVIIMKVFEKIQEKTKSPEFISTQYHTKETKYEATVEKTPGRPDLLAKYKEGLSILELSGDDLGFAEESNPQSISACSPILKQVPKHEDGSDELA